MSLKLSIITPSFNQASFLEETLRSVLSQRYNNLEYIVIDGGSTDGSAEIISRYSSHLAYWVSESDQGQAHAINKGIAKATGDIVAFLNSDDLYLPGVFNAVNEYFHSNPNCHWLCGDTIMFGEGHPTHLIQAQVPRSAAHSLSWAYNAPQPGMFWRRELLQSGFEERWRYCFDHELYVRLLLSGYKCDHLPVPVAAYRLHSDSKTIAEGSNFDDEFDEIAAIYEPHLKGAGRRWCAATRLLRRSCSASYAGKRREALYSLLKALAIHPESTLRRPFWGSLHRAIRSNSLRETEKDNS